MQLLDVQLLANHWRLVAHKENITNHRMDYYAAISKSTTFGEGVDPNSATTRLPFRILTLAVWQFACQ